MSKTSEIANTLQIVEKMFMQLRQVTDDAWDYVNKHRQKW